MKPLYTIITMLLSLLAWIMESQAQAGFPETVTIGNSTIRIVIDPAHGGRLIEYSRNGRNILYEVPEGSGWVYPQNNKYIGPAGGRFDVGPEMLMPEHPILYERAWQVIEANPAYAIIRSQNDPATGLSLTREFRFDGKTGILSCTQTMTNITEKTISCCYWGRTLVKGNGVCIIPQSGVSRYPKGYLLFSGWPEFLIETKPKAPEVTVIDDFMLVTGPPKYSKIGWDSTAGWMAYASRDDLLFIKRFPVYPNRKYAEFTGMTLSVWFNEHEMCELEPIGPEEILAPGASASFTEEWKLVDFKFPEAGINRKKLTAIVNEYGRMESGEFISH